ncbi:unnamed protein product [Eruca vesicaria subsp. sativa]|uniref:RING-type E3 ubiquitin transferase n=1 Tax=Eruca vesicaria subsp. sativa TaxID=29727 RepID=A0ABC8M6J8_ERUVS|nr:unnamed protein product [Eruca vesicaria subsp. sativa]
MFNNTTTGAFVPTPSTTVPTTVFPGTTITSNSTFIIIGPPPPFPAPPRSINFTPLILIIAVIAIVAVPALIYALFFSRSSRRRSSSSSRRRSNSSFSDDHVTVEITSPTTAERDASTVAPDSGGKFKKETHSKETGNECPVCLSVFADGEEIRQLSACKHAFHVSCIEPWLKDHLNCPICRAGVAVKQTEANVNVNGNVNRSGGGNRRVSATS